MPMTANSRDGRGAVAPLAIALTLLGGAEVLAEELVPNKPSDQRPLLDNPLAAWGSEYTNWVEFFRNLQFVVIDEMHTYRGVFGSHVANVLRRLKRVASFYGASPQFILTSATIANPPTTEVSRSISLTLSSPKSRSSRAENTGTAEVPPVRRTTSISDGVTPASAITCAMPFSTTVNGSSSTPTSFSPRGIFTM